MENACSNIITANPADVILFVFAMVVLFVLIGCIWAFFYAIFLFIFSGGDGGKVKTARNAIRYMIIGLFLSVMVLFIGPTILKLFGIQNANYYSTKFIFAKVGNIITCVSTGVVKVVTDYSNNNPFGDLYYPVGNTQVIGNDINNDIYIYEL